MAPDGSDVKILTTAAYLAEVPSWSPDRTWIAYDYASVALDGSSFHTSLYRMNADGTQPQLLGDPDTFDVEPKISPDGKSVLFERLTFPGGNQHNALMIRDIATGTERHLDSAGEFVEHANWSPDGLWVICNVAHALTSTVANDQIERVRADGSAEPEVLLKGTSTQTGFKASYSPDGASIVFGCFGSAGDTATCVMNADGSNVHVVADEPNVDENQFSWGVTPAS
jgi:Tol biopolymer transport system component